MQNVSDDAQVYKLIALLERLNIHTFLDDVVLK